jgi:hypothetical protein
MVELADLGFSTLELLPFLTGRLVALATYGFQRPVYINRLAIIISLHQNILIYFFHFIFQKGSNESGLFYEGSSGTSSDGRICSML